MVCLDTSCLIDIILGKPLPEKFKDILDGKENVSIASPSVIELIKGLHLRKNIKYVAEEEKEKINNAINSLIVFSLDKKSAVLSGKIEAELRNAGEPIGIIDIMIGAIAITNNEILLTRNKKHFDKIKGLKIESY